jgi:hypothetical protein
MPQDSTSDIIIVSVQNPTVTINIKKNEICTLVNLKFSHCGNIEEKYKNFK